MDIVREGNMIVVEMVEYREELMLVRAKGNDWGHMEIDVAGQGIDMGVSYIIREKLIYTVTNSEEHLTILQYKDAEVDDAGKRKVFANPVATTSVYVKCRRPRQLN